MIETKIHYTKEELYQYELSKSKYIIIMNYKEINLSNFCKKNYHYSIIKLSEYKKNQNIYKSNNLIFVIKIFNKEEELYFIKQIKQLKIINTNHNIYIIDYIITLNQLEKNNLQKIKLTNIIYNDIILNKSYKYVLKTETGDQYKIMSIEMDYKIEMDYIFYKSIYTINDCSKGRLIQNSGTCYLNSVLNGLILSKKKQ